MRISYEWLGDFVDLDGVTPKDAAEVLTRLGVEVESMTVVDLSQIVIGKVLEQKPHPKSRNPLWIHQVDLGDHVQQIIAGAPNAVPGSLVPVALPGTTVPNGKVVKDMNIAGWIKGVRVGPSPDWMQRRLRACGVRPINNIVDITNYVLLEYAQPLHAFDLARLSGPAIHVRRACANEKLLALDGLVRDLTSDMLVIADALRPVAVAGVIGGEETAVTTATRDILLESANFNGPSVPQTSRALGVRTEASARFGRALRPALPCARGPRP